MAHRIPSAFAAAALAAAALALPQTLSAREPGPLDALLVVQNHVSDDFRKPLADLGDRVSAALSGDILHIIDPNDAIGANQNRAPWGEGMPDTSATRLAGNLGAEALVTASVGEASVSGIGYPPVAQMVRMTLTLSAKRLPSGAALAAVTVTEQSPNLTLDVMAQNADAVYSELLGRLVSKASAQFLAKVAAVTVPDVAPEKVTVFFGCNVLGADVQIDGLSMGTCPGQFSVAPGVHNVLVSYPPYYLPFARQAGFETDGQTYAVVLQITPEGEQQRLRAIDWERKRAELDVWKRDQDLDFETRRGQAGFDLEKARRELNFEFDRKRRQLDRELAEGSELFKKQLDLADAMVERYRLSGEADDYVRTTIADGTSLYWQNSYGRIAITDGSAENIEFATPSTDSGDLAVPPGPKEISENLQKFLMKR
ncbi:MAG: hypothetical protein IKQ55_02720 [Kiritimatiellae bacterium]|nr:hypothetical protein [Kiritimatiellia bacterium]